METSTNSSGHSSHRIDALRSGAPPASRPSRDAPSCASVPFPLPSPASEKLSSSSLHSELRFRIRLDKQDARTQLGAQIIDADCIRTGATLSDRGCPSRANTSGCGTLTDGEDMARSVKKSRMDDPTVRGGSGIAEQNRNLASKEERTARRGSGPERGELRDRDDPSSFSSRSTLNTEPHSAIPAACVQATRPPHRLPHKKAFKTMRFLTEVRDPLTEKLGHRGADSRGFLETRSSSRSPEGVGGVKDSRAKATVIGGSGDLSLILPPGLKRARSSRGKRKCKKLASREGRPEDGPINTEEASKQRFGFMEEEVDSHETIRGGEDAGFSGKGAYVAEKMPTYVGEGTLKGMPVTCQLGEHLETRGGVLFQTEGSSTVKWTAVDKLEVHSRKAARNAIVEMVEDMDYRASKKVGSGMKIPEGMSRQSSEFRDGEEAPRDLSDEVAGDRACHGASHGTVQDVAAAADMVRGHDTVPDSIGGQETVNGGCLPSGSSRSAVQGGSMFSPSNEAPVVVEQHVTIQGSEMGKESDASKGFPNLSAADIGCLHMKDLAIVECSESEGQVESTPRLSLNSSGDVGDSSAGKVGGYISQCPTQKPSKPETHPLSLAPPGMVGAGAEYGLNVKKGLELAIRPSQMPAQTYVQCQIQMQNSQSQTNSGRLTGSLSFPHSFLHNPSCSLNSLSTEDQELLCGGYRHTLQGVGNTSLRGLGVAGADENDGSLGLHHDKSKQGQAAPIYQWATHIGNIHSSRAYEEIPSGKQEVLAVATRSLNLCMDDFRGTAREGIRCNEFTVAARETWSKPLADNGKVHKPASSADTYVAPPQSEGLGGDDNKLRGNFGLREIAAEPVATVAQRMQELPDSCLESLRSLVRDLLHNFEKRGEFLTLQSIIKRRSDLTENTLLRAQYTQLEILVALRTGEQAFVQVSAKPLTYKALIEIFLQKRCKNLACQQSLPVDGCDCKVCLQTGGFCHECMCVVCSRFDSDSQTCHWVGCEFCMHWCHADCGLRMLHIVPAQSSEGEAGSMQYQCVACGCKSELFGLVKNVFHHFSEKWDTKAFTKELDCVRRIFHGSQDARGRQLCRKVEIMLWELDMNVDVARIRRSILQFFNEADSGVRGSQLVAVVADVQSTMPQTSKSLDGNAMATQEAATPMVPTVENKFRRQPFEATAAATKMAEDGAQLIRDGQAHTNTVAEDMRTMVELLQADAKMLELHADEARKQARGLQHIISVKQDKIEGDYMSKCAKLRLTEAEEKMNRRLSELLAIERDHYGSLSTKLMIEARITDLAMKMGSIRWQYA